jgi:hypothetical protein
MTRRSLRQQITTAGALAAIALASASCGEVVRTGRSPAFLIIENMSASAGESTEYTAFLLSDVQTGGGVFNDNGRAALRLALKNPGTPTAPLGPTTMNEITLTRYHVKYIRSDGRNVQGVDIPYEFDGGLTVTVPSQGAAEAGFLLVRHTAKREAPLRNMWDGGGMRLLNAIAEVTFYGRDQAGNEVTAVGNINITFGDFADPES